MSHSLGKVLLDLCSHAKNEVLLVAPFIKADSIKRIFHSLPKDVERIIVVTRWFPNEVALGVSDTEVLDIVNQKKNAKLLLYPSLHAKYYRVDNRCLVGSANITSRALGWCAAANLELLIETNPEDTSIKQLEEKLMSESILATEKIKLAVLAEAELFKLQLKESLTKAIEPFSEVTSPWLPTCNKPEYLFRIYSSEDTSSLLSSVVDAAKNDLKILKVLPGLTEKEFNRCVATLFENTPATQEIYSLTKGSGITADAAEVVLSKYRDQINNPTYTANVYWEVFKIWLTFFFPGLYRVRATAEVLEIAKEI